MCHQVIQIYGCGHSRPSRAVRCRTPTSKCGGIFLRQELENIRGLCIVSRLPGVISTFLSSSVMSKSIQVEVGTAAA
ncbi:hypothetical protein L207DRAFT_160586 [Hyaloscypha variabilis F]|uniref:Uncharacterized protein n=1 Tax=Hyaloscypha variabilis (strain UAMH 11265 / GT02V1 / F) TaxID=1149755 RepID=A0A2J6SA03_HYAVF|nr:hypothetical protein L207DRAFT_160586 [Hyaloscypha variabilis F]